MISTTLVRTASTYRIDAMNPMPGCPCAISRGSGCIPLLRARLCGSGDCGLAGGGPVPVSCGPAVPGSPGQRGDIAGHGETDASAHEFAGEDETVDPAAFRAGEPVAHQ